MKLIGFQYQWQENLKTMDINLDITNAKSGQKTNSCRKFDISFLENKQKVSGTMNSHEARHQFKGTDKETSRMFFFNF